MKHSILFQAVAALAYYNHGMIANATATVQANDVVDNVSTDTNTDATADSEATESIMKARSVQVDTDDDSFFDYSAKNYHDGKEIHFDRFEGYITVVTNMAKACKSVDQVELALAATTGLFDIMPYSLNVLIFPFLHPNINYNGDDDDDAADADDGVCALDGEGDEVESDDSKNALNCDAFDAKLKSYATDPKFKNKLYIMEELSTLNDDNDNDNSSASEVHPVYRYLKSKFDIEELSTKYGTFFFVSSEGERIDFVQGHSFREVRDWIKKLTKNNYDLWVFLGC